MNYRNLIFMMVASFVSMYVLMYVMVNSFVNVYSNLNQFYMAAVMTMPMLWIELWLMKDMYPNTRLNRAIAVLSLAAFLTFLFFIRRQAFISDKEFLKSMIPHHASALLMCEQAALQDPEVKKLCESIRATQQEEIDFMKSKEKTLQKN